VVEIEALRALKFKKENTPIDKTDPRSRALISLTLAFLSLYSQSLLKQSLLLATAACIAIVARRGARFVSILRATAPLALLIFVLNYITAPQPGWVGPALMALRFLTLSTSLSLFFMTTSPDEVSLMLESAHLPREYAMLITMSFRFVPTLALDVESVMHALQSRGFELEKGSLTQRVRNYVYLMVPLIIFEVRRSLMAAEALEARGFGSSRKPTSYIRLRFTALDGVAIALVTIYLLSFILLVPD